MVEYLTCSNIMRILDFSAISARSFLGRSLRRALDWIPDESVLPVIQGPARGLRWVVGSGVNGCWLGSYEKPKQEQLSVALRSGDAFFDIGANVGFYTLLASRGVGATGSVVAFEPVPKNLSFLRRHVELNRLRNVRVFDCALSDCDGQGAFDCGDSSSTGRLSGGGALTVRTARLDTIMEQGSLTPPHCMKIDVEGAEAAVLRGAMVTLAKFRPMIFLATHGPEVHRECLAILSQLGYHCAPLDGRRDLLSTDELLARPGPCPQP